MAMGTPCGEGLLQPAILKTDRLLEAADSSRRREPLYRVLASQMVVDHRIGQRDQQTVAAVTALDTRLLMRNKTG